MKASIMFIVLIWIFPQTLKSQIKFSKADYSYIENKFVDGIEIILSYKYGSNEYIEQLIKKDRTVTQSEENNITYTLIDSPYLDMVSILNDNKGTLVSYVFEYEIENKTLENQLSTVSQAIDFITVSKISSKKAQKNVEAGNGKIKNDELMGKIYEEFKNSTLTQVTDDLDFNKTGQLNEYIDVYALNFENMHLSELTIGLKRDDINKKIYVFIGSYVNAQQKHMLDRSVPLNKNNLKKCLGVF